MSTTRRSIIALAAVAVVVAVVATIMTVAYHDGARPGTAFPGISRFDSAHEAEVKLPIGTLEVQVGSPSQEYRIEYPDRTRAADGAVFVPVAWSIGGGGSTSSRNFEPVYQYQVTLVADGRRYDLQAGYADHPSDGYLSVVPEGSVAVVVEGEGDDLSIEVEYDGLTQTLDVDSGKVDAGLAAPYYAAGGFPTRQPSDGCSGVPENDRTVYARLDECDLGPVELVPYVGGYGWVRSARESWALVPYKLQVGDLRTRPRSKEYDTTVRRFEVTLDGRPPVADILRFRSNDTAYIVGTKVFRSSSTPKQLGLRTELVGRPYDKSPSRTVGHTQTFPLA